mmetsp:Transcript_25792/g.53302  ORF Transcript_25792/g.53302 Transcript_25792/m.53302 type:complete len:197 (+) Transcript_25792:220-810(+)
MSVDDTPSEMIVEDIPTGNSNVTIADVSALEHNIQSKGKNAYYFAHSHKATGPKWDGKIEPRLLSRESSSNIDSSSSGAGLVSSLSKSNITNYAFLDEEEKVKLYVNLAGVGDCCSDDDIKLDFTETSLRLKVMNFVSPGSGEGDEPENTKKGEDRSLVFGKLFGEIENATFRKKTDKIIITLKKKEVKQWKKLVA